MACQKLRIDEEEVKDEVKKDVMQEGQEAVQEVKEADDQEEQEDSEPESDTDPDPYGSLDGGSPRNFSADEEESEDKEEDDDEDKDDDGEPPRSPDVDVEKSAKRARISPIVMYQLRMTYGINKNNILEAVVTSAIQPACYVVSCVLFSKMKDARWRVVQSHQNGDAGYVYVKMHEQDLKRFHGKLYQWDGARVIFCKVKSVMPIMPDPMDAHPVEKIY